MSKYIDADKLKKIVEQAKQRALKGAEVDEDYYCNGRADAFEEVLLEIDSLQQEQPEVDLPKWRFATKHLSDDDVLRMDEDGSIFADINVFRGEYYIPLSDLRKLPKED